MDKWLVALLVGLAGGVGGGLGVHFLLRDGSARESGTAPAGDDGTLRQIRDDIAALSAKVDHRLAEGGSATGATLGRTSSAPAPTALSGTGSAASEGPQYMPGMTREQMDALLSKAVEDGLAKQAAKEAASKPPEKKKATLAEVARELSLPASVEDEIRRAYADADEKYLKLMAEPDGDVNAVRREMEGAKDDPAKKTGLMMKYLPKVLGKFPEMMAIESERTSRIHKALGPENTKKFGQYDVEESSPFGLDANVSILDDK